MGYLPVDSNSRTIFPTLAATYDLFEGMLPTTGHTAYMIALAIASKHVVNSDRPLNIAPIAWTGDGKTTLLKQFLSCPKVDFEERFTLASFLAKRGGKFLTRLGTGLTPDGVSRTEDGGWKIDQDAPDLIDGYTLMLPETKPLADMSFESFQRVLDIGGSLMEEGWAKSEDNFNGHFMIGSPFNRLGFNMVASCTPDVWQKFLSVNTFASRVIPLHFGSMEAEVHEIHTKARSGYFDGGSKTRTPTSQQEVRNLLYSDAGEFRFGNREVIVPRDGDLNVCLDNLWNTIRYHKLETLGMRVVGKRESRDVMRMSRANALINGRQEVTILDVLLCEILIKSHTVMKQEDEQGRQYLIPTCSRAHFQARFCLLFGLDVDTQLSTFTDADGKRVYSQADIGAVKKDIGWAG